MKTLILDLNNKINDIVINTDTEIYALWQGNKSMCTYQQFKIIHQLPGLKSRVTVKAVLKDKANFEFYPTLIIKRGAKQTDSYLKISVLLLSDTAKAQVRPAMQITEADVKAGHGASIGKLDKEQLYYLVAHGLSLTKAKELLTAAFIKDIIAVTSTSSK